MDGIAVNPIDRLKYRAIRWLLEKLYERPAGFLLADGAIPASIQAMDMLFENRPLAAFLPYEVFTDEGLFKSVNGSKLQRAHTIFSFAFALKVPHRLQAVQARALAQVIEASLPSHYVLQVISARLPGDEDQYTALVCLTAPDDTPRSSVLAVRDVYEAVFYDFDIAVERLDPDSLLRFVCQAFDSEAAAPYNDHDLICDQCAFSGVGITPQGIELRNAENVPFRVLHLYTPRRYGMGDPIPLLQIFPAIINDLRFIAQFVGTRDADGLAGQFVFAEIAEVGEGSHAPDVFASRGWLIEKDVYNAHLSFLSLFPMAVSATMAKQLLRLRRWRRFNAEHVQAILPLPFQANILTPGDAGAVLTFKKEPAHV